MNRTGILKPLTVRSNLAAGFAGFRIGVQIDDADVRAGLRALRRERTRLEREQLRSRSDPARCRSASGSSLADFKGWT
jgi:hypothetical protein